MGSKGKSDRFKGKLEGSDLWPETSEGQPKEAEGWPLGSVGQPEGSKYQPDRCDGQLRVLKNSKWGGLRASWRGVRAR